MMIDFPPGDRSGLTRPRGVTPPALCRRIPFARSSDTCGGQCEDGSDDDVAALMQGSLKFHGALYHRVGIQY